MQSNKIAELEAPRGEILEYPRRDVNLGCTPSHMSISCDQALLGIAFIKDGCPCAAVYSVASFFSKVSHYYQSSNV